MLSGITQRFLSSLRPTYWDAPDHFTARRQRGSGADIERRLTEERIRAMRNVGMW